MTAVLLDGQALADETPQELIDAIAALKAQGHDVCLGIVYIGKNLSSDVYVAKKQEAGEKLGIRVDVFSDRTRKGITVAELIPEDSLDSPEALRLYLEDLVQRHDDDDMDGIIVQLPLPKNIREENGVDKTQYILDAIPAEKDVDLLSTAAEEALRDNRSPIIPPTIAGIVKLLEKYDIPIQDRDVLFVGKGKLVGKPGISVFQNLGANVSEIDENTPKDDYERELREADIIITGVGKPGLITGDMVGEGQVIIDAGTGKGGKGDVEFESVAPKARYITPVPGGVGPMTVAELLSNTVTLTKLRHGIK